MVLVGLAEIIEIKVFVLILHVHDAVALVAHVLLASPGVAELFAAEEAEIADVDSLGHVCEQALEVDEAVDIENGEGMLDSHVVEALLDAVVLLIAEEAASETLQGRDAWWLLVRSIFWHLEFGHWLAIFVDLAHHLTFLAHNTFILILRYTLEDAAGIRIWILLLIVLLVLLMFLAFLVLFHLLSALEQLITRLTFVNHFADRTSVGTHHLCLFLLKDVLGDRIEFGHSSLGIVYVEFGRQMQFIVDDGVEFDMTC